MAETSDSKYYHIGAISDRGSVRERNEDYFGIFEPETDELMERRGVLIVVADGMGGHFAGAQASRRMVDMLSHEYYNGDDDNPAARLQEAFSAANRRVFNEVGDGRQGLAGTTCTSAALFVDHVNVAHAGDSRAYLVTPDGIEQITEDHSVVGEMLRKGMLSKDEARQHPRRNVITRAVGLHEEVDPDLFERIPVGPGDIVLLCSDGLTTMLTEEEIAEIVRASTPEGACIDLVRRAKESGGEDNITAIIAHRR